MNGWCLRNVYRIDGKLVVGKDIEDAIAVYRLYSTPNNVEIKSVEQIFGDSMRVFGDAVCRETEDRKAAETIALLTEQNEELRKKYEELENSFSEMKKDIELQRKMRGITTGVPVVLGSEIVDEEYHESEDVLMFMTLVVQCWRRLWSAMAEIVRRLHRSWVSANVRCTAG